MPNKRRINTTHGSGAEGLKLSDIKYQGPPPRFAGQQRYWIGPDHSGRDQFVTLKPQQVKAASLKHAIFQFVEVIGYHPDGPAPFCSLAE